MKTAEELLKEKGGHIITVSPDTPMQEVLRTMVEKHIAAMLVEEKSKIAGIWTDRDLLRDVLNPTFDPKTTKIGDVMVKSLPTAPYTDTVYQLKDKFLGKKVRHLLITKDEKYIGLLSVGDVLINSLLEKDDELTQLNARCNWNYYEDWQRWRKKKK